MQLAARPICGGEKAKHSPLEQRVLRCQACQSNGFENLPLYAAALVRLLISHRSVALLLGFLGLR